MFNAGDTVMHPTEGVCRVEDVRTLQFGSAPQPYYVLHPTGEKASSTVYLPVFRGDSVLRRLLSREDILRLIRESHDYEGLWIEDGRLRKEAFQKILEEGNYAKIIRMILELHQARQRRQQCRKGLPLQIAHQAQRRAEGPPAQVKGLRLCQSGRPSALC